MYYDSLDIDETMLCYGFQNLCSCDYYNLNNS